LREPEFQSSLKKPGLISLVFRIGFNPSAPGKVKGSKILASLIIQKRFRKRLFFPMVCVILTHRLERDTPLVKG